MKGDEIYCRKTCTDTYNGVPKHGRAGNVKEFPYTYGGYSNKYIVNERFAIKIPD